MHTLNYYSIDYSVRASYPEYQACGAVAAAAAAIADSYETAAAVVGD